MVPQIKIPSGSGDAPLVGAALPAELALWLERSLGVMTRSGGGPSAAVAAEMPWLGSAELTRLAARNAVLRALAQRFFPGVPVSIQAALIGIRAERFAFAQWPRDSERAQIPARYRDTPDEFLWAAFKTGAPMPVDKRSLRRILIGVPEFDADDAGDTA